MGRQIRHVGRQIGHLGRQIRHLGRQIRHPALDPYIPKSLNSKSLEYMLKVLRLLFVQKRT